MYKVKEDQRVHLATIEFLDYALQWWHKTLVPSRTLSVDKVKVKVNVRDKVNARRRQEKASPREGVAKREGIARIRRRQGNASPREKASPRAR